MLVCKLHILLLFEKVPPQWQPFFWQCKSSECLFVLACTCRFAVLGLFHATGAPCTLVSAYSGGGIVLHVHGMVNVMPAGMWKKPTMPRSVHNSPLGTTVLLGDFEAKYWFMRTHNLIYQTGNIIFIHIKACRYIYFPNFISTCNFM